MITVTGINYMVGINRITISTDFDSDAQAFITAAGITDDTQKTAINTLLNHLVHLILHGLVHQHLQTLVCQDGISINTETLTILLTPV